jgi:hypothetical protein
MEFNEKIDERQWKELIGLLKESSGEICKKLDKLAELSENQSVKTLASLDKLADLESQILKAIQAPQNVAVKLGWHFVSQAEGEINMALSLPVGQTDHYYINATDANGDPGASLAPGQVIALVASDPASVVLTPDATPQVDPKTNIQSVASGTVADGPAAVLNTAVTCTATLTDADGVTVLDTETDTVTPLVGSAKKIGILFEDASLNPSPAGAKRPLPPRK